MHSTLRSRPLRLRPDAFSGQLSLPVSSIVPPVLALLHSVFTRLVRPAQRWAWVLGVWALGWAGATTGHAAIGDDYHGLPFIRSYPYDEIGYASRSAKLGFDNFGRIAVVREGAFIVLNDDTWLNLAADGSPVMVKVEPGKDGRLYFGARGNWGRFDLTPNVGTVLASRTASTPPLWVESSYFDNIITTPDRIYFGSWNGTVEWDPANNEHHYHRMEDQSSLIEIGGRIYLANRRGMVFPLNPPPGGQTTEPVVTDGPLVDFATRLDANRALVTTSGGRFFTFDGKRFTPWKRETVGTRGRSIISGLRQLVDGKIAVAELGHGLFLYTPEGRLLASFTTPRFRQISDLACNESGVLWLATEDAVVKVLYDCAVEDFGHDLGLIPRWPLVAEHAGKTYVASDGTLYTVTAGAENRTATVVPMKTQPPGGAWALAAANDELFVGSTMAVFRLEDERYVPVLDFPGLGNLVTIDDGLVMAVSGDAIGGLRKVNGEWKELAPRVKGLGYSPIVHGSSAGLWVELADRGVALASYDRAHDRISIQTLVPWPDARWTNVSILRDYAVLTASEDRFRFYNLHTQTWDEPPRIKAALATAGQWLIRMKEGADGVLWGVTHQALVGLFPDGPDRFVLDARSFDFTNDLYPVAHVLPSGTVWITANQSLYRLSKRVQHQPIPIAKPRVILAQPADSRESIPLARASDGSLEAHLPGKGVTLRLFSGGYNHRRPPAYVYRLGGQEWAPIESGSLLSLRELGEGTHELAIRPRDAKAEEAPLATAVLRLKVPAPWYRTLLARIAQGLLLVAAFLVAVRISNRVVRRRSEALERLVSERTKQLESAMERLHEETKSAATLAERNRLAGEIHDSLQQGLSGAMLQLDSTMVLPEINDRIQQRLQIVRNMISFTRHEVQNAVWDKESPLLGDGELGEALHRLTAFVQNESNEIHVEVKGTPFPLSTDVKHHLMRIAQESMTNAVRHAKASTISITLTYEPGRIVMEVADNGIGFTPTKALNIDHGHFGLHGLHHRATRLGAKLSLRSAPGEGTRITVDLAVPALSPT